MSTYAIGDIHGCYDQLQALLTKIEFDPKKDILWFTGDLINGGPKPAEVLRFIKSLGDRQVCVIGNHDLVLLSVAAGKLSPPNNREIGFEPVLEAPDCAELVAWLRMCPLAHYDAKFNTLLVHAGIIPQWSLQQALDHAHEVETLLRGTDLDDFYDNMYGNDPDTWDKSLTGWPRIRFFLSVFTRMRFCTSQGKLDLETKGDMDNAPAGYLPWFKIPRDQDNNLKILFGHWAGILGRTDVDNAIGLDTGCVWGHRLTALCLDTWQFYSVPK